MRGPFFHPQIAQIAQIAQMGGAKARALHLL
jgi:hypothetical protein